MHSSSDDTEDSSSSSSFCSRSSCLQISDQEITTEGTADSILFQTG